MATRAPPARRPKAPKASALDKRLLEAAAFNRPELFEELLALGASPDARFGLDPLRRATVGMLCADIYGHNMRRFDTHPGHRLVLERCDPLAVDADGLTALMRAAAEKSLDALAILAPRSALAQQVAPARGRRDFVGWNAACFAVNSNLAFQSAAQSHASQSRCARAARLCCDDQALAVQTREDGGLLQINARFGPKPLVEEALRSLRLEFDCLREAQAIDGSLAPASRAPSRRRPL